MQYGIYRTLINFVNFLFKKSIFNKKHKKKHFQKHVQVDFSLIDRLEHTFHDERFYKYVYNCLVSLLQSVIVSLFVLFYMNNTPQWHGLRPLCYTKKR